MNTRAIKIQKQADESDDELKAKALLNPSIRGAITIDAYTINGMQSDISKLVATLEQQCKSGDFDSESMLIAQAQTLDCLFHNLAYNASLNLANNTAAAETLLKLAFRAQNQAGKTLQVILQNKLLTSGDKDGSQLDTRATIDAIASDKKHQIWLSSTGAKTAEGKAKVSRNAYKGGLRPMMLQVAHALREQQKTIEQLATAC